MKTSKKMRLFLSMIIGTALTIPAALLFTKHFFATPVQTENIQSLTETTQTSPPETPTIYVSIVTHSEDTLSPGNPDFQTDESSTITERDGVIHFAQMLAKHGAKYDWQSDWNFIQGLLQWDEGSTETDGKNLAQYLQSIGMSTDPHSHEKLGYNYADVAYLIAQLGVTPSGIVGGFTASPASSSKYESNSQPRKGNTYPDYLWTPTAMWGGGTANHVNESSLWSSGIWIPTSNQHLFTPTTNGVPIIGKYNGDFTGLDNLLEKQASGELITGNMYTVTVTTNQNMLTDDYISAFEKKLETYAQKTAEKKIVWVTLPEALTIWQEQYQSQPTILLYDGDETKSELSPESSKETPKTNTLHRKSETCGNGTCETIERIKGTCETDCH